MSVTGSSLERLKISVFESFASRSSSLEFFLFAAETCKGRRESCEVGCVSIFSTEVEAGAFGLLCFRFRLPPAAVFAPSRVARLSDKAGGLPLPGVESRDDLVVDRKRIERRIEQIGVQATSAP